MKVYLASFFQSENHGPGRKIAIAANKPNNFQVDGAWKQVIPSQEILSKYRSIQLEDQQDAAEYFKYNYNKQLKDFFDEMKVDAEKEGKSTIDFVPLETGDTLLSWERAENTSYRSILAKYLVDLGIEVVIN